MKAIKQFFLGLMVSVPLALASVGAHASGGGYALDKFPTEKLDSNASLQNGAKLFVNYCLNCHSAGSMRYNRLKDIGLTDDLIKKYLLFTTDKVGEQMKVTLRPQDAKEWFGAVPPDLSVLARARASGDGSGADWLYTYLRTYYRDGTRPTGWNNALFPNVGMPNVLWELQGLRGASIVDTKEVKDEKGGHSTFTKTTAVYGADGSRTETTAAAPGHPHPGTVYTLDDATGGKLRSAAFDDQVGDLVAYMTYMSDPSAKTRTGLGMWVLLYLLIFTAIAWNLNRNYWKDVK